MSARARSGGASALTYQRAVDEHRWRVPERYNIAADVCDRHPREKPAMIHERYDGVVREVSWGELQDLSNRFANLLARYGVAKGDLRTIVELGGIIQTTDPQVAAERDQRMLAQSTPMKRLSADLGSSGLRCILIALACSPALRVMPHCGA